MARASAPSLASTMRCARSPRAFALSLLSSLFRKQRAYLCALPLVGRSFQQFEIVLDVLA
jgi:hypothetical protein